MIWGPRNTEKGFLFLAALAALGLPWSLTHSLIVLDSKHSSLPDQTPSSQNWWGSWENMTWLTKWQIHLENTFKERSLKLFTFETFDQSDGETWTYFSYVPLLVPPLFHFVPPIWGVHNPFMAQTRFNHWFCQINNFAQRPLCKHTVHS